MSDTQTLQCLQRTSCFLHMLLSVSVDLIKSLKHACIVLHCETRTARKVAPSSREIRKVAPSSRWHQARKVAPCKGMLERRHHAKASRNSKSGTKLGSIESLCFSIIVKWQKKQPAPDLAQHCLHFANAIVHAFKLSFDPLLRLGIINQSV